MRPTPEPPSLDDEALAALTHAARLAGDVGLLPRVEGFSARIARWAEEEGLAGIGSGYLTLQSGEDRRLARPERALVGSWFISLE